MKSLFALLIIPIILLTVIFIIKYTSCIREYRSESRSLRRRIRYASDERSLEHWKKRLKWQKFLLIPFVGRFMRDYALKRYANRKVKRY